MFFLLHESYLNNIVGVYLVCTMSSLSTYNFPACVRLVFWQCNLGGGLRQNQNMLQGLIYFILPAGSAPPKLGNNSINDVFGRRATVESYKIPLL